MRDTRHHGPPRVSPLRNIIGYLPGGVQWGGAGWAAGEARGQLGRGKRPRSGDGGMGGGPAPDRPRQAAPPGVSGARGL